jgi:hypothetical protein
LLLKIAKIANEYSLWYLLFVILYNYHYHLFLNYVCQMDAQVMAEYSQESNSLNLDSEPNLLIRKTSLLVECKE